MRTIFVLVLVTLSAAGCGDNLRPSETGTSTPGGASSVGGSQIARSKSFMLVTNVASSNQSTASNSSVTLTSGLGAQ